MSEYDFKLEYDKNVMVADALSRDPRYEQVMHKVSVDDMICALRCVDSDGNVRMAEGYHPDAVIELGCGGGGAGIGPAKAGYHTVAGVDNNRAALEVFRDAHEGLVCHYR